MSVINQLLLDLEKRRASSAERSVLPNHVRALPQGEREMNWGWIAAGGAAVAVALAGGWMFLYGSDWMRLRAERPVGPPAAEAAIEKVVAVSAGVALAAQPDESPQRDGPASRMSFELSSPPIASEPSPARAPVLASRVVGHSEGDAPAPTVRAEPAKAPAGPVKPAAGNPAIQKEVRQPTPRELAENEYRKAVVSMQQGRLAEAREGFQAALNLYAGYHGARQALVGVLIEEKKPGEAERVLQEGLTLAPAQIGFAMTLARLQVDRSDTAQATATLRKSLDYAQGSADYLAFLAALLQRQAHHEEAIEQFQGALRLRPTAGVWWLGLGISLQAANHVAEARDAFRRARATNNLGPELAAFADQRLRQLQ